jgi:hypothetical protein
MTDRCKYVGCCVNQLYDVQVREACGSGWTGRFYSVRVHLPTDMRSVYVSDECNRIIDRLAISPEEVDATRAVDIAEDFVQRHYGRGA